MFRAPLVPLFLAAALFATQAAAQTDLKPRPNATPPALTPTHSPGRGAPDRERVTTRVAMGEAAPDFELEKIDGTPLRLSKQHGDWLMLCFVERRESLDVLAPAARALKDLGVRTLAVCYDKSHALSHYMAGRDLGL